MAVTTDLVFFEGATGGSYSDCDATTDWLPAPTLDTEIFIQGTGALSAKVSKATVTTLFSLASTWAASTAYSLDDCVIPTTWNGWFYRCTTAGTSGATEPVWPTTEGETVTDGTVVWTTEAPPDLTGKSLYCWAYILEIGILDTKANKGFGIRIEDGLGNWGEWNIAGTDTWGGQWKCFAQYTGATFSDQSATPPDLTAILKVGVFFTTTALPKAYPNVFWDALRYGTYLRAYGGTEASPVDFDEILTTEDQVANKWGILERSEGIIMAQGNLRFGSTTDGEATYFKDISEVLVFKERPVETVLYEMVVEGNPTATTKIYFGSKVGDRGVSGCAFRSAGTSKFKFTATDTNITDLGVYGCSFYDAETISLPPYSTTREVLSCNFEVCAEVLADTCIVQYCNFISADGRGIRMSSENHNITDSNFINCPDGVHIPNVGTYTFDALIFSGNTYDIENSSPGLVTVNATNGANPGTVENTGGGSTIINNPITHTLTGMKENSEVHYIRTSDDVEIFQVENVDVSGETNYQYNYVADINVYILIHHIDYETILIENVILSNVDASIPITQYEDRVYANP